MLKIYITRQYLDRNLTKTDELTRRHTHSNHPGMINVMFELTNTLRDEYGAVVFSDPTYRPEKSKFTPPPKRMDFSPIGEADLTYVEEFDYYIQDCELIIYDTDTDCLRMISLKEGPSGMWEVFNERNNEKDIFLISQFYNWFPFEHDSSKYNFKTSTMPYYVSYPLTNVDFYYERRKYIMGEHRHELEDKMFGGGTTDRPDFITLQEKNYLGIRRGSFEQYLTEAIRYKVGLSIGGVAEICHREIDYMAIGLPNMHLEYMTPLNPPLIPNVHYISVSREKYGLPRDSHHNRVGGEQYVNAYLERFLEVKDDEEFLRYIASNAREYYENYCSHGNRIKHLLKLLEL